MRSAKKDKPACVILIRDKEQSSIDNVPREITPFAVGWIIDERQLDATTQMQFYDTMENLGFDQNMAKKI